MKLWMYDALYTNKNEFISVYYTSNRIQTKNNFDYQSINNLWFIKGTNNPYHQVWMRKEL